jgi:hypothetical protein
LSGWSGLVSYFSGGYLEIQENEKTKKPEVVEIKGENVTPLKKYYQFKDGSPILKSNVQKVLKSYLNSSSPIAQFDMSNLVPAELGLEIDGTGGITPFDIIHTEYIQGIYKSDISVENFVMGEQEVINQNSAASGVGRRMSADPDSTGVEIDDEERVTEEQLATTSTRIGPLTFFQIKDVKHTLDESGWKTEITSVMRINRIQRFDKISGLIVQSDKIIPYETKRIPLESLEGDMAGDETLEDLDFGDYPLFEEPPIPQTKVLDLNVSPTALEKEIKKIEETALDNTFIMPGRINSAGDPPGVTITDMSPGNIKNALRHASKYGEDKVRNADGTPFDFDGLKPKPEDPPIKASAPLAKAYGKKLELNRMPFADLPIPEKVDQIAIPEVKRHIYVQPKQQVDLREYGTVKQVKGSTFTDMRFAKLTTKEFDAPVEATIQAIEPIKEEKLSEVINNPLPVVEEIVILKSTYNPSWPDWATNPTFKLIYKIVPGWYTKSTNNPKNTSFYGEPPTSAVAKRFRQKFWDEVIEMPNETGTTSLDNTAAINARLAEIGDTYKDLGPYDTWKPITGLDYARYSPTTGKADYTENGVKIVLPKGAN